VLLGGGLLLGADQHDNQSETNDSQNDDANKIFHKASELACRNGLWQAPKKGWPEHFLELPPAGLR
jgi:hypothetical protein